MEGAGFGQGGSSQRREPSHRKPAPAGNRSQGERLGGGGGIRTRGPREGTPVFKTGAFDHSATPPRKWLRVSLSGVWGALGLLLAEAFTRRARLLVSSARGSSFRFTRTCRVRGLRGSAAWAVASGFFAVMLEAEKGRPETEGYLDRYGWDVSEDEDSWRYYQRGSSSGSMAAMRVGGAPRLRLNARHRCGRYKGRRVLVCSALTCGGRIESTRGRQGAHHPTQRSVQRPRAR